MSFGYPFALVALLVVPATLALAVALRRRPSPHAVVFTNLDVLASVAERERRWRPWLPVALLLLALTLAAGALAQPHVNLPARVDNATVVLLVDVSGSMRAHDVEPTRLDAATAAMRLFLDRLPERFRVGVLEFSSSSDVLTLPVHDRVQVRAALAYLEPDAGTAIGDGLATATAILKRSLAEQRDRSVDGKAGLGAIVLLSDGTQTAGRRRPLAGAALAKAAGFRVDTVALGTTGPDAVVPGPGNVLLLVPPDPGLMREIAAATGGRTFTATTAPEMSEVFAGLSSSIGRERQSREITSWFALGAAGALLAAVAFGRLLAGALTS